MSTRRDAALKAISAGQAPEAAMLAAGYGERLARLQGPTWWIYFGVDNPEGQAEAEPTKDEPEEATEEVAQRKPPPVPQPAPKTNEHATRAKKTAAQRKAAKPKTTNNEGASE